MTFRIVTVIAIAIAAVAGGVAPLRIKKLSTALRRRALEPSFVVVQARRLTLVVMVVVIEKRVPVVAVRRLAVRVVGLRLQDRPCHAGVRPDAARGWLFVVLDGVA